MEWHKKIMPLSLGELTWGPNVTIVSVDFSDAERGFWTDRVQPIIKCAHEHRAEEEIALDGFTMHFAFKSPHDAVLFKLTL